MEVLTRNNLDSALHADRSMHEMLSCISKGDPVYLPSKFWQALNEKNSSQLRSEGIENLKRTLAQNYFTWMVMRNDPQFEYLVKHTTFPAWFSILKGAWRRDSSSGLTWKRQAILSVFTRMLWKFAEQVDTEKLLKRLEEPQEGNPFSIFLGRKLISQDLANSVLEYYSIREHLKASTDDEVVVCELGAGYGRDAYVFLNAFPRCKYIIIDIPPALYVSQHYLAAVFPEKNLFKFRCFDDFEACRTEFQESDIAFLLPHQAEMLPPKMVDLFINISSLHEMKMEQIEAYFRMVNRLTEGYFYSKQWLVSENPVDGIRVKHDDYAVPRNWEQLYFRRARVQDAFFEAMYSIRGSSSVTGRASAA